MISPGRWVTDLDLILGCLVGLRINADAFRSIRLNRDPILDSGHYECVTFPPDQSQGCVFRGASAMCSEAGLEFCPVLSIFGTLVPEIKAHPKLVELVRSKQNMNGT